MKKKIGLAGFDKDKVIELKKSFKTIEFVILSSSNFFQKTELNAIIVFTEGGLSNCIDDFFLKKKYENFENLNWFHLSRAGVEEYASEFDLLNFKLTCGKIIQGPNVSEHCLAMLLFISRGLKYVDDKKKLSRKRPLELYKKKALVIGLGGVGRMICQKLNAFGIKVSAVDINYSSLSNYIEDLYLFEDLKQIVKNFDIVINACSLTDMTKNLFNKKMKFYGVGLDVIDPEPLPKNHEIRKFSEVFFTDHTAGWSENLNRRFKLIKDNLSRFEKENKLLNIVKEY